MGVLAQGAKCLRQTALAARLSTDLAAQAAPLHQVSAPVISLDSWPDRLSSHTQSGSRASAHIQSVDLTFSQGRQSSCSRHLRVRPLQDSRRRDFATNAEKYDLIEEEVGVIRVDGCNAEGFILNGDRFVHGPILCTRETYFSWKPRGLQQVNQDAFSFLDLIRPQPELILIGTGREMQPLAKDLQDCLSSKGMFHEALSTPNAIATFNILNQEARKVVGAFFPTA